MANSPQSVIASLKKEILRVFTGKTETVEGILLGLFSGLHVLLEDLPGVGKTTLIRTLARVSGLDFGRIQFTPDLLPGDILGMNIWSREKEAFVFKPGGIMHQLVLADEINRASARTQAGLLEVMQEGRVTVDGITREVPLPFTVFATQNPVSFSGTYQLPEAQADRFGLTLSLGYPDEQEELRIMETVRNPDPYNGLEAVTGPEEILEFRAAVRSVHTDVKIREFIVRLAAASRKSPLIQLGMSPRASGQLLVIAQTSAFLGGRDYVVPEDILKHASSALAHRLIPSPEARMNGMNARGILDKLLGSVPVPAGI